MGLQLFVYHFKYHYKQFSKYLNSSKHNMSYQVDYKCHCKLVYAPQRRVNVNYAPLQLSALFLRIQGIFRYRVVGILFYKKHKRILLHFQTSQTSPFYVKLIICSCKVCFFFMTEKETEKAVENFFIFWGLFYVAVA